MVPKALVPRRHTTVLATLALAATIGAVLVVACRQPPAAAPRAGTASAQPPASVTPTPADLAPARAGGYAITLDLDYVDRDSPAFERFHDWVDSAVDGRPGYAFAASDAALLHRMRERPEYCRLAVDMVERQVADAERAIAAGNAPEIAGDSYLEVGPRIADLALTLDTCGTQVSPEQRTRWSAFAAQAVWNVWHPDQAHWGSLRRPWTGWSIDNPGNNYYYSFTEATLYWALVSGDTRWLRFLHESRMPALTDYFGKLAGGGSREGTGYGAAHMRLFSLYRLWRDGTGDDIANRTRHVDDSIAYWVHATVPTLDRFAPIGDQSRNSVPELYDYHRRLVLEARQLSRSADHQALASWWLHRISVPRMTGGFNTVHDLLPAGPEAGAAPTALFHHATGTGHLFARSGWDRDAMWLAVVAGPYDESHAHQEQGGFTLFARDWLTVTENIWTHSGIQQGTETHNVLRFERDAPIEGQCQAPANDRVVHQCAPTTSTMTVTPGADGALRIDTDLTAAYRGNPAVRQWTRRFDFGGRRLRITDRYAVGAGTRAVFQLNLPTEPRIDGATATAGRLRVRVVEPTGATLRALDWRSLDAQEFRGGWRLDIAGGTGTYVVELDEIQE